MEKAARLKLIGKLYQEYRRKKREGTAKRWPPNGKRRQEPHHAIRTILDFSEEDIREEIELMGVFRRPIDNGADSDVERFYG